jgi:CRISPR/Cas system-associated exonuclease Cas4 (RecB family)
MRKIRASEIGTFLYCERAWWYQQQGVPSENITELVQGSKLHQEHGRVVFFSGLLRTLAYGALLAAVILLVAYLTQQIL